MKKRKRILIKAQSNNKTGPLGVTRRKQTSRKNETIYCWQATWIDPELGRHKTVCFSESKYGASLAKKLAVMSRKNKRRAKIAVSR